MRVSRKSTLIFGLAALLACISSTQAALVAHYKFDEAIGAATAVNELVTGDGTVNSGVTTGVAGIDGNAYSFNGVTASGYVNMGDATGIFDTFSPANLAGASNKLTMSAWIKGTLPTTATNGGFTFISMADTSNNTKYVEISSTTTGYVADPLTPGTNRAAGSIRSSSTNFIDGVTAVNDDVWHHVAYTLDMDALVGKLYVDGNLEATTAITIAGFHHFNSFNVGRLTRSTAAAPFTGLIDDVRIYSHVLSGSEVSGLYTAFIPEPGSMSLLGIAMIGLVASRRRRAL